CILIRASSTKLVDTMKKMSSSNTTSMSDVRFMSGSSCARGRSFMASADARGRRLAFERLDELHRFFLHLHDEAFDLATEKFVRAERRDRHPETSGRRPQRLGDAARERGGTADAFGRDRVEGLDHAEHRAEESHQRRERRDRAEAADETIELVDD